MTIKFLSLLFLISSLNSACAQDKMNLNEMVGFACGFAGTPTETVKEMGQRLQKKDYKWISKKLSSDNNAERYMAAISLEKLDELGKYDISSIEKSQITEIKQSDEFVYVCSGCTFFQKVKLKDLFTSKTPLNINNWFNSVFH